MERLIDIERRLATECQKTMHIGPDGKAQWGPNPKALDPHAARVVVDSIKWRLSKLLPQVYGDRQQLEVSGEVKVTRPSRDAPEWMQERLKAKLGEAVVEEAAADPPPAKDEPTVH